MIDFKTRTTRIRIIQSIFYVILVAIYIQNYGYTFYFVLAALLNSFVEIDKSDMIYWWNISDVHSQDKVVLYWILLSPIWISVILMPIYRSIKRWVSRGQ